MMQDAQETEMSYDRSFGEDRHDLRSPLLEREPEGLMGLAAKAARRVLRRAPEAPRDGAALARVAGGPARQDTAR